MLDRPVSHLVHLVDDLLDVSRITRGNVALRREKSRLTDVLINAIEASCPLIEEHAHQLDVNVRPNPPVIIEAIRSALYKSFRICSPTARNIRIAVAAHARVSGWGSRTQRARPWNRDPASRARERV
jgi:hypothetical protein